MQIPSLEFRYLGMAEFYDLGFVHLHSGAWQLKFLLSTNLTTLQSKCIPIIILV